MYKLLYMQYFLINPMVEFLKTHIDHVVNKIKQKSVDSAIYFFALWLIFLPTIGAIFSKSSFKALNCSG